jgi:MFS family permease
MFAVLRQRNFALLWVGGLISLLGDWTLMVGLPLFVYALTGSTISTGTTFIAGLVPRVLLGSVAGVFVDRWDRKRTMVLTDLLLALCLLPLFAVQSADRLWIVYLAQFGESSIVQFFRPAEGAILPRLLGEEYLVSANSLTAMSENLARLIGPPIGGSIFAFVGLKGVVVADSGSFLAAAVLIALITTDTRPARTAVIAMKRPGEAWSAIWHEWRDGLRLVPGDRLLAMLFVFIAITGVGEGIISTLFVPFVTRILGGNGLDFGWILSAQALGGLAGSLIVGHMGLKVAPSRMLGITAVLFGFADLAVFYYPYFVSGTLLALFFMVIAGVLVAGMAVSLLTLEQTAVADAYRGRILGAFGTTGALLRLVGSVIAGVLGDRLGIVSVISVQGFGYIVAGVMVLAVVHRIGSAKAPVRKERTPLPENAGIPGR